MITLSGFVRSYRLLIAPDLTLEHCTDGAIWTEHEFPIYLISETEAGDAQTGGSFM